MTDISGTTALVTGASRGFGRATASHLAQAGARVIGVARDAGRLEELSAALGDGFTPVAADAADPVVAGQLIDAYRPRTLVLAAGPARWPGRCSGRRGRRSAGTGRSTSGRCSTGRARRCWPRSRRAAW
jgi:NAD(P)-dependent dehydrogenase (short-subunit alcohol dehydrogenase family)